MDENHFLQFTTTPVKESSAKALLAAIPNLAKITGEFSRLQRIHLDSNPQVILGLLALLAKLIPTNPSNGTKLTISRQLY